MYAIIATGGKQYKVAEGETVRVEKLGLAEGEAVTFDNVLMISNDDGVSVGERYITNASVTGKVAREGKEKKVIIYKYKAKKGYHKKQGHRQPFTEVKIEKINA
jgi:large subunit ribosomal protein L21